MTHPLPAPGGFPSGEDLADDPLQAPDTWVVAVPLDELLRELAAGQPDRRQVALYAALLDRAADHVDRLVLDAGRPLPWPAGVGAEQALAAAMVNAAPAVVWPLRQKARLMRLGLDVGFGPREPLGRLARHLLGVTWPGWYECRACSASSPNPVDVAERFCFVCKRVAA